MARARLCFHLQEGQQTFETDGRGQPPGVRTFGIAHMTRPEAGDLVVIDRPGWRACYQILEVRPGGESGWDRPGDGLPRIGFWRGRMQDIVGTSLLTPELQEFLEVTLGPNPLEHVAHAGR